MGGRKKRKGGGGGRLEFFDVYNIFVENFLDKTVNGPPFTLLLGLVLRTFGLVRVWKFDFQNVVNFYLH